MGSTWGRQDPGGPHVGPMNLAIWVFITKDVYSIEIPVKTYLYGVVICAVNWMSNSFIETSWQHSVHSSTIIDSNDDLSHVQCQTITWTNAGFVLIIPLWINTSAFKWKCSIFFKKMNLKMPYAKWWAIVTSSIYQQCVLVGWVWLYSEVINRHEFITTVVIPINFVTISLYQYRTGFQWVIYIYEYPNMYPSTYRNRLRWYKFGKDDLFAVHFF